MAVARNIRFHYIKSPQEVEHEVDADGKLGVEIAEARVGRKGIVRELEVDLVMSFVAQLNGLAVTTCSRTSSQQR